MLRARTAGLDPTMRLDTWQNHRTCNTTGPCSLTLRPCGSPRTATGSSSLARSASARPTWPPRGTHRGPPPAQRALHPRAGHGRPNDVAASVMPGRFHQQPPRMGVPRIGDRPKRPRLPELDSDGVRPTNAPITRAGQLVPVTDLDRQPERSQRGHPSQAAQPLHDGSELAVCPRPSPRSRRPAGRDARW